MQYDSIAEMVEEWQELVDLLARVFAVPVGLIMRLDQDALEVLVSSRSSGNPYTVGSREVMKDSGLYCEAAIREKTLIKVPNALTDAHWKNNPDVKLGMISYLGLPILFSDGNPFGTLCVLDSKENHYSEEFEGILRSLRRLIERELEILLKNQQLKVLSETDPLTGILNRLSFMSRSEAELKRAGRYARNLSVLMIDLDDFKRVNDRYGHLMGDAVLKMVAEAVTANLRASDIFGRFGGEEFVLALPETDHEAALALAERIRESIASRTVTLNEVSVRVTASIGVGTPRPEDALDDLLRRADAHMYAAKKAGKNQIK